MQVVERSSVLWSYFPSEIKGLIEDGEKLLEDAKKYPAKVSDYSYLVFPFSKAYEGFLKKFLLDLKLIKDDEYYGDDIRIGKILNPYYIKEHQNVFNKVCEKSDDGKQVAHRLWKIWKRGRNQVFHYFPHNFRKLDYKESLDIVKELIGSMDEAVNKCDLGHMLY